MNGNAGAGEARPFGVADAGQLAGVPARELEHLSGERREPAHVVARGELGDDSAVGSVHIDL